MSKTERALDDDAAALDELDDFVAAEAEAADRAIGELIDDAVDGSNGHRAIAEHDRDGAHTGNGFDTSEIEAPDVEEFATGEIEAPEDVEQFATGELPAPAAANGSVALDEESDFVEVVHQEEPIAADEDDHPLPAPSIGDTVVEGTVIADTVVEDTVVEDPVVEDTVVEDAGAEVYTLPEIVPATVDDETDDADGAVAREGDLDEVSDDILEELRRADIDGPIVDFAPQDDTSSARRRPKRSPDYDPAPVPIPVRPPRILGRKPRVRKVTRVVRQVDPWSVFKIAALASMVLYVIMLTAGVLLWNVAYATGTVDNVERFFESFGWSSFEFNGGEIYHASWIAGLFAVVGLTGMAVLTATLFNLITDIVGGVRFTVLEEEVVESRTSPMRRFVVRRPEPEVPAIIRDSSGSMIREAVVDDSGAIER